MVVVMVAMIFPMVLLMITIVIVLIVVVVMVIIVLFTGRTMPLLYTNLLPLLTTSHTILPPKAGLRPLGTTMLLSRLWMFALNLIPPTMELRLLLLAVSTVIVNHALLAMRATANAILDTIAGLERLRTAVA